MRRFLPKLTLAVLLSASSLTAQEMQIALPDIEGLSDRYSPEWQQFDEQLEVEQRGAQAAAARLNPTLNYDLEFLDNDPRPEREHFLFIEQPLRTPGHFRHLRQHRDLRMGEAEQRIESGRASWMADTRFGFIRIVLAREELDRLQQIHSLVDRIRNALAQRAGERETSRIDEQLLTMSSYQLSSRIDDRRIELETEKSEWLARMGIDGEERSVEFTGAFSDPDYILPDREELMGMLDRSPGRQASRLALAGAGRAVDLEESRRWPSFALRAGYKTMNPELHGFIVGVSLPIPLLNRNRPAIQEARAHERVRELSLRSAEQRQNRELIRALRTLDDYRSRLDEFPGQVEDPETLTHTLLIAYEEGEHSLNDLLNTLHLMADTQQTYFRQIEKTYEQIMILEALTGQEILHADGRQINPE